MKEDWALIMSFDTNSSEFVRGFEAGRIYTKMREAPEELDGQMFHATNTEMVLRMIEATGVSLTAEFSSEDKWMILRLKAE